MAYQQRVLQIPARSLRCASTRWHRLAQRGRAGGPVQRTRLGTPHPLDQADFPATALDPQTPEWDPPGVLAFGGK